MACISGFADTKEFPGSQCDTNGCVCGHDYLCQCNYRVLCVHCYHEHNKTCTICYPYEKDYADYMSANYSPNETEN